MQTRLAVNILIRFAIIALAGFVLWEFREEIWMEMQNLAHRPFNPFTLGAGVLAPAFAIAAIFFAAANKYLLLAALCSVISLGIFVTLLMVFIFTFAK